MIDSETSFEPLQEDHFPLIYDWFNSPHIQAFYSLRSAKAQGIISQQELGKRTKFVKKSAEHKDSFGIVFTRFMLLFLANWLSRLLISLLKI